MAKNYDWERAKALYGLGKTERQIEGETKIPRATLQRMIKKEGWKKGDLSQAIASGVQFVENLSQKSEPQIKMVQNEVEKIAKARGLFFDGSIALVNRIIELATTENDLTKLNHGMQALKTGRQAAGIDPIHAPKEIKNEEQNAGNQTVRLEIVGVNASDTNTR